MKKLKKKVIEKLTNLIDEKIYQVNSRDINHVEALTKLLDVILMYEVERDT